MDTMVAEIYGRRRKPARRREHRPRLFETTAGVVDVHDSMEAPRDRILVSLDREKAGLKGIPAMAAVETLAVPAPAATSPVSTPDLARAGSGARPTVRR